MEKVGFVIPGYENEKDLVVFDISDQEWDQEKAAFQKAAATFKLPLAYEPEALSKEQLQFQSQSMIFGEPNPKGKSSSSPHKVEIDDMFVPKSTSTFSVDVDDNFIDSSQTFHINSEDLELIEINAQGHGVFKIRNPPPEASSEFLIRPLGISDQLQIQQLRAKK